MLDKIVNSIYNKYNTSKPLNESYIFTESTSDIDSLKKDLQQIDGHAWFTPFEYMDDLQQTHSLSINDIIKEAHKLGLEVYESPMGYFGFGKDNYIICKSLDDVINAFKEYGESTDIDAKTAKIMSNPESFTLVDPDFLDVFPKGSSFFLDDDEIMNKDKSGKEIFIGYLNDDGSIELNSGIDLSSKDEEALLSYIQDNYNKNAYIA